MDSKTLNNSAKVRWSVLLMLSAVMFASYFFDDIFTTIGHIFKNPDLVALGWNSAEYGVYGGAYSFLCVWGGLVICGMLIDKWGVKLTGTLFVSLMVAGASVVAYAISESFASSSLCAVLSSFFGKPSLALAYAGCALFGLGSEIAGVAVTRSIAKWFKGYEMALAMGLQLAIARLGTAFALVLVPRIVNTASAPIPFSETSKPAGVGLILMAVGIIAWVAFVLADRRLDRQSEELAALDRKETSEDDKFKFSDILKVLGNKYFIYIALICVLFYCCIISFRRFATSILIPRFGISQDAASLMVSMIPFSTVVFMPLFGSLVDHKGRGSRLMILGAFLVLVAHLIVAFAPQYEVFGYVGIAILGIGYSLLPSAMWQTVPKIIPDKNLGTAYSLLYWIQNLGLMTVPVFVGRIIKNNPSPVAPEYLFISLAVASIIVSILFAKASDARPDLKIDVPNKVKK